MNQQRQPDDKAEQFCPHCHGKLEPFKAVQRCVECDRAWFILQTSSGPKKERNDELEARTEEGR